MGAPVGGWNLDRARNCDRLRAISVRRAATLLKGVAGTSLSPFGPAKKEVLEGGDSNYHRYFPA